MFRVIMVYMDSLLLL